MTQWRKIPEAGTVFGIRALALFTRLVGRRIAGWFLYIVAFYYALFRGDARRASRDYLRRVGARTRFRDVVRHIHTFAQVSLDRLFFLTGRLEPFRFEHFNHDLLVEASKSGRGVLLLGAHFGSFEVMRCRAKEFGIPINVVVDFRSTERVNGVLRSLAPDIDFRLISMAEDPITTVLAIRAAIDRGEVVAILADRLADESKAASRSKDRAVITEFLGADAAFPAGPWLLAHTLRCPVYFVAGVFTRPNQYSLHFETLADEVRLDRKERTVALQRYARVYASMLESYVRSAPLNWFNFFDFWSVRG